MRRRRILLVHAAHESSATLSYQRGWPRAFLRSGAFEAEPLDLARTTRLPGRLRTRRWDAVVLLHSVFSNALYLPKRLVERLSRLRAPVAWFIGNEYKLMPEKMELAERLGVALLVTQIDSEPVRELYRRRLGSEVASIPNTGVDPALFDPRTPPDERPIDLGYRAYDGPLYLGHDERRRLPEAVGEHARAHGLAVDASLDPAARFTEPDWASFLDRCKGQLGFEAGTDFFELDDRTRIAVNAYVDRHPDAGHAEIHRQFFAHYENPVSGRTLSGRVIEAAAMRNAQILLEGRYGGAFEPGVHYIPLRKDYSDVDEALTQFRDPAIRRRIGDAARELALAEYTYERLVERFRAQLERVL